MSCFGYNYCYYFSYNRRQPKTIIKKKIKILLQSIEQEFIEFFFYNLFKNSMRFSASFQASFSIYLWIFTNESSSIAASQIVVSILSTIFSKVKTFLIVAVMIWLIGSPISEIKFLICCWPKEFSSACACAICPKTITDI